MRVVGVDLSLTSTGIASSDGWVERVQSKPLGNTLRQRCSRLDIIVSTVLLMISSQGQPDLVVIEAPSYGSKGGSAHDRSGLHWLLVHSLISAGRPVIEIPPTCRMKYATGRGQSDKDKVLACAIRRYPEFDITGHDVADAVVLMHMGLDLYGWIPTGGYHSVPVVNRAALDKLQRVEGVPHGGLG